MVRQLHVLGVTDDGDALLLGPAPAKSGSSSDKPSHRVRLDDRLRAAVPPTTSEPAREESEVIPVDVVTPEAKAGRETTRGNDLAVVRLSRLVVELEWALLKEALPPPGEIDPLTATDEQIKAYLTLHPRLGRPPPR